MPEDSSRRFDRDVRSVGAARRFAVETADRWGVDARDIALVVGELAANAVVHGNSAFEVRLRQDRRVHVEVSDLGSDEVRREPVAPQVEHGRGLEIVDHLAADWGVRQVPEGGKVVWARIET